ncbi:hypothetical protein Hanom_Chr12g01148711 [Helianthus anomalus]
MVKIGLRRSKSVLGGQNRTNRSMFYSPLNTKFDPFLNLAHFFTAQILLKPILTFNFRYFNI